jgi:SagB-type dehydrogenase family enzyme
VGDQDPAEKAFTVLATRANSYRAATPWFTATAFRTSVDRHAHLDFGAPPQMAEEFLVAAQLNPHDREVIRSVADYVADEFVPVVGATDTESVPAADRVELPDPLELTAPLGEVIRRRRSAREFSGGPVAFAEIATLVRAVAGTTRTAGDSVLPGRAVPSGGGLYPVELWMIALDVTGLGRGVYRYAPRLDVFERCGDEDVVERFLREGLIDVGAASPANGAAAVAGLVARPWRSMRKYGPRGLRLVLHEVGAMSQHLHLAATALDLASTDWSSFYDRPANRCLTLDGLRQTLLHTVLVGRPTS